MALDLTVNPSSREVEEPSPLLGIPNLQTVVDLLGNLALNWRWIALLPTVQGTVKSSLVAVNGGAAEGSTSGAGTKVFPPYGFVSGMEVSPNSISTEARARAGSAINVPRSISPQPVALSFFERRDYITTRYLTAWSSEIKDDAGNYGNPIDYKKQLELRAYDSTDNYNPMLQVKFIDCFPTDPVGGLSYSYDASGIISVTCTFSVDGQEMYFNTSSAYRASLNAK